MKLIHLLFPRLLDGIRLRVFSIAIQFFPDQEDREIIMRTNAILKQLRDDIITWTIMLERSMITEKDIEQLIRQRKQVIHASFNMVEPSLIDDFAAAVTRVIIKAVCSAKPGGKAADYSPSLFSKIVSDIVSRTLS